MDGLTGTGGATAEAGYGLMEEALSAVVPLWCGTCEPCGEDKNEVENTAPLSEKTHAYCGLHSCGAIPICLGGEEDEDEDFALSEDDILAIQEHVQSADPRAAVNVLARYSSKVDFVEARGSLQLLGCSGAILANLPLTGEQIDAVVMAQQQ